MHLPADMDHNEFDFMEDLVKPFTEFNKRIDDSKKFVKHGSKKEIKKEEDSKNNEEEEKKQESSNEHLEERISEIDESCCEYNHDSKTFEMFFDRKLYDPPKPVIEIELQIAQ